MYLIVAHVTALSRLSSESNLMPWVPGPGARPPPPLVLGKCTWCGAWGRAAGPSLPADSLRVMLCFLN